MNAIEQIVIITELKATGKKEVLRELAAAAVEQHPGLELEGLCAILEEREELGSTGIGDGVAIPHGKVPELAEMVMVFGRSTQGIPFAAQDGRPVHLFFLLLAPAASSTPYLGRLAELARFLRDHQIRARLQQAESREELARILRDEGQEGNHEQG
ncbi:PTS sugar transporter subunit IIA [Desulfurivibrio alkaliphilus]|uniref:Putative PTS IIA-like nitrogen-regulatory protein PtsN n=1 Tax=Desulfurivibrio alkaliphilus (strain DSM 19089 / UNIQEM U267 / AHT2) TaxID=589865 RepID=D6Z6A5_DESAT|nr:PTS sugar transporter subunit IIA [Desulfurivibrio alkaliphilus]ADH86870.1 putative PTS IIA-like nitrogen-regulatory protein PtsN [Desulfurivibrio alkaliphilus AHT 2]